MKYLYLFIIIVLISSCERFTSYTSESDVQPTIEKIPVIELLNVTPNTVQQFTDSIVFSIKYTDGDGDLGTYDADETPIEVIDNRNPSLIFPFHLPPLSPSNSDIIIQGELNIVLRNLILLDASNQSETTTFSIRLRDQANNWSNTVTSDNVTINN